jgi:anti-anti-sigma regulatory factor
MQIRIISEDCLLVELPSQETGITEQLKAVNEYISNNGGYDVVVDFSKVEIINSANISNLLILRSFVEDSGHRLSLCNVRTLTKCIFVVAGLDETFNFADDNSTTKSATQNIVDK